MGVGRIRDERGAEVSPWDAVRGRSRKESGEALSRIVAPILGGLILVVFAIGAVSTAAPIVGVTLAAAVAFALLRPRTGTPARTTPTRSPDAVAAHLHDSVLQTLALIQRSANDPARVSHLARGQERELRDWLAGRDTASAPTTIAGAVRGVAADVEREHPGATIDVVCVGDAPLGRRGEMLVQAAREAMRNAVRHGSPAVRVFSECDGDHTRVFVRDTGPGFDLDDVGEDRRGLRDAIVGRMRHVDGRVTIDSSEHGTEVELHLPPTGTTNGG